MWPFSSDKDLVEIGKSIKPKIIGALTQFEKEGVDGLGKFLEKENCNFNIYEHGKYKNVRWTYPALDFEFNIIENDLHVAGKEKYFGLALSGDTGLLCADAKSEMSAGGIPTTRKAIRLKDMLVSDFGFRDISRIF